MSRMRMIQLIKSLLFTIIALAASSASVWSQSPEPRVRLEPANIQAHAGERVEVTVEIQDVVNLGAFQFDLTYDPAVVQVETVTLGDFPRSTDRNVTPLGPRIEDGKTVYGAFSFGDAAGPDGSGTLAIVTLAAQAGGQTPLGLANVQVIDISGSRIQVTTQGATITVSGSPAAPTSPTQTGDVGPGLLATATAQVTLVTPERDESVEAQPASRGVDWIVTGAVLVGLVILVALAARLMTR